MTRVGQKGQKMQRRALRLFTDCTYPVFLSYTYLGNCEERED
jgi:hypothetical protein